MASNEDVKLSIEDSSKTNDAEVKVKPEDPEDKKSGGACAADMWYSPKGKSIPCIICLILLYIIFLPIILIGLFAFCIWYCIQKIYLCLFMTSLRSHTVE